MTNFDKSVRLFFLLFRSPSEFSERVSSLAEARRDRAQSNGISYRVQTEADAFDLLETQLHGNLSSRNQEVPFARIEAKIERGKAQMPREAPFGAFHNGDSLLGRVCYSVVRVLQPDVVVETGVCYGVTSSYVLTALDTNGRGVLHSIDLPPLGKDGDRFVGWLIPGELRSRWNLHRGASRRLLRPLLAQVGPLDLFIHDSLHTYGNMRDEFALAWPALRPGGVLISDDIEGNTAFLELSQRPDVAQSIVIKESNKDSLLGVTVKRS
jgi:predicted O-methyltransferase YrrM